MTTTDTAIDIRERAFFRPSARGRLVLTRPPLWGRWRSIRPWPKQPPQGGGGGQCDELQDGEPQPDDEQPPVPVEPQDLDDENEPQDDVDEPEGEDADEDEVADAEADAEPEPDEPPEPAYELDELPDLPPSLPGLVRNDSDMIERHFDSWYDFVLCAADTDLNCSERKPSQRIVDGSPREVNRYGRVTKIWNEEAIDTFYATTNLQAAVDMALRLGWPEGRERLTDTLGAIRPRPTNFASRTYDVGGMYPVVPLFVAGDPACMVDFHTDHLATNPVVVIEYNRAVSSYVSADSIMNYGAAVLSLAYNLENLGYSVELRFAAQVLCGDGTLRHRTTVVYKKAGELLDLDRATFAIAHPSAHRRLTFSVREQHPELVKFEHAGGLGIHGQPEDVPIREANVISIPHIDDNYSLEEAKEIVEKAASSFLTAAEAAD